MKRIRPVEIETCCICGEQFDKIKMKDMSIGRTTKWMCPECYARAQRQLDAKRAEWRRSPKGKQVIKASEKYK